MMLGTTNIKKEKKNEITVPPYLWASQVNIEPTEFPLNLVRTTGHLCVV